MRDIMELVHEDVLEGRDLRIVVKAEEELSQVNTISCELYPVLCPVQPLTLTSQCKGFTRLLPRPQGMLFLKYLGR